jgi:hypothetical protein
MPEVTTVVTLNSKEVADAIIAVAKVAVEKVIGGAEIRYHISDGKVQEVTVSFTGKIRT